jgi:pimeloyl-ACP methyl ester carboxylesterase
MVQEKNVALGLSGPKKAQGPEGALREQKVDGISFLAGRWPLEPAKPTLIFLHGAALSGGIWEGQLLALRNIANTLALDLPGHGKSAGPGREAIEDYSRSVMEFLDRLQVSRPIPCGLSMGGAVVLQLLLSHPGRFFAGILVNTGAKLKVASLVFEAIQKDFARFPWMICKTGLSQKSGSKVCEKVRACVQCAPEVALGDFLACDRFDVRQNLQTIEAPVLVLSASEDVLTPFKYASFLVERLKHAKLTCIEDAGHLSPVEKPEALNAAIREFVRTASLESRVS